VEERQKFVAVAVVDRDAEEMSFLYERRPRTCRTHVQHVRYVVLLQIHQQHDKPFNGPLSRTTRESRHQNSETLTQYTTLASLFSSLLFSMGQTAIKLSGAEAADRAQCTDIGRMLA